jgi:predicted RNA methylase
MKTTKEYWSMTEGVFNCLLDKKRTNAFRNAIMKTVRQGDIVVDMGTGSGVLAMFAVDAGASKVYAVEFDEKNILTLKKTFQVNGYDNKIAILKGDVTKIKLPEKVDVIVGEMIATALIEESQIPAMNNMLKNAKKGVRVVLNKYENFIDLVFNNETFYGKTFPVLRYEYPGEGDLKSISFSKKERYAVVDFSKINQSNVIDRKIKVAVNKSGKINGIRLSSQSVFYDGSKLDASFAYSYPIILPIDEVSVCVCV